jgi:hypothetical protein
LVDTSSGRGTGSSSGGDRDETRTSRYEARAGGGLQSLAAAGLSSSHRWALDLPDGKRGGGEERWCAALGVEGVAAGVELGVGAGGAPSGEERGAIRWRNRSNILHG